MAFFKKNNKEVAQSQSAEVKTSVAQQEQVVETQEQAVTPEERVQEQASAQEILSEQTPSSTTPPPPQQQSPISEEQHQSKADPMFSEVEDILEEDMGEVYSQLDPYVQQEFKKRGEETTALIVRLVRTAKVTAQRVFQLVLSWLKIIPHVNKYYLEQEAKIKADKIVHKAHEAEEERPKDLKIDR